MKNHPLQVRLSSHCQNLADAQVVTRTELCHLSPEEVWMITHENAARFRRSDGPERPPC